MRRLSGPRTLSLTACLLAVALVGQSVRADVVVLTNQTSQPVKMTVRRPGIASKVLRLASRELITIPTQAPLQVIIQSENQRENQSENEPTSYEVGVDCACYIRRGDDNRCVLEQIDLGGPFSRRADGSSQLAGLEEIGVVTLRILVDDEELAARSVWESRLRKRIEAASKIFETYFRIRFQVVDVGTWQSDDQLRAFGDLLRDFERQVSASPAMVAIGFTGQKATDTGDQHLGVTRGPLHSHLLLSEWSPETSEAERFEILVHELGHYLGAAHSPGDSSVMRPILGDGKARARNFEVQFDPVNALAVYLVGEDIRFRNAANVSQLTPETRARLARIYAAIGEAMPDDPVASDLRALMEGRRSRRFQSGARLVAAAMERRAAANPTLHGDEATDMLVRTAALAASTLPRDVGPTAFVLALNSLLAESALSLDAIVNSVRLDSSAPPQRVVPSRISAELTMRGRRDFAEHFLASAYLTALIGQRAASAAGLAKELFDSHGNSGFSFADLAADRAGVAFAVAVLRGELPLETLAEKFSTGKFLPSVDGFKEGLSWKDFSQAYTGPNEASFKIEEREIERRVAALPGYRMATVPSDASRGNPNRDK